MKWSPSSGTLSARPVPVANAWHHFLVGLRDPLLGGELLAMFI